MPNRLKEIEKWTFQSCNKLASVTIPNSIERIAESAFSGCYNLTDIYNLSETPQVVEDYAFQNYCNLHVLPGCISSYESADPWNKFIIIEDATGIDLVNIQNKELFIYNLQGHHKSSADRFMIQNKKKFYVK